jgi:hypothetical protein
MVGIKCSAGCHLSGQRFSIADREGRQVAVAQLGRGTWPGTDALYFAEVEAQAPPATGSHQWEVSTAAWTCNLPHAPGSVALAFKAVSPPDCEVTVEAVGRENQTPIKGARVVMHPYRATTDEDGIARVKVTKGRYDILVSASKYAPFSTTVEVAADMVTKAELDAEPPLESPDEVF